MDLNQQTRIYYDQDETQYHRINSEKRVRWYTDDLSTNKTPVRQQHKIYR